MTEHLPTNRIVAATDGSAMRNEGPGGWAWVTTGGEYAWGSETETTHNRMELTAVLELLRSHPTGSLLIQADSTYVINIFEEWLPRWQEQDMRTNKGEPVKNQDLIEQIERLLTGRDVEWEWVKGHSGHALNETADRFAKHGTYRVRWELRDVLGEELLGKFNRMFEPLIDNEGHQSTRGS